MTDRELLELAAKAAGLPVVFDEGYSNGYWPCGRDDDGDVDRYWNPLTDDGDALRLAIEADITVDAPKDGKFVYAGGQGSFSEPVGENKMAATRRAIVRAAAAIGEAMP